MDYSSLIDIAIGVATLGGMILTGLGAVWVFFRKRLRAWWKPYRAGIDGMTELPHIRKSVEAARHEVAGLGQQMGMMSLMIRARGDINIEAGEFETDADGQWTYANQTLARWLGVGKKELLGWGWVNSVPASERDSIRAELALCRAEHRVYSGRHHLIASDGELLMVDTIATPIPDAPPAKQWIGVMRRVVT